MVLNVCSGGMSDARGSGGTSLQMWGFSWPIQVVISFELPDIIV